MANKPIYLDYNATTPVDPRVANAMLPYLYDHFGNPSSSHSYGAEAKKGVELARRQIAEMINSLPEEVIFTSGGSESNNMAIKGAVMANRAKGNHIITSSIEHPAVLEVCTYLEENSFNVTYLPVDEFGMVDVVEVEQAITPQTIMISIMHANNEVGTIQPIKALSEIARSHNIIFHSDAAQSIGKIPVNVEELGVDLLSIAGHKFYAPKGIGALYIRTGIKLHKLIHGAQHEKNLRAGTENVLEIAGFGRAAELISENLEQFTAHMLDMREQLEDSIIKRFPWARVNGHPEKRLPNTTSISFKGLEANTIMAELQGVAASAGAACHAEKVDVSHVLQALKVPVEFAMGTIRFSVGRFTTSEEISKAIEEIAVVVESLCPGTSFTNIQLKTDEIRLTQFTHGLGCACKLRPQLLEQILREMPVIEDKNILVGTETGDDAAVFLFNDETAIVQTVDFFTPIVDDPYTFGAISAANSLSDVYAMGAKPMFALSVVAFPSKRLSIDVLKAILRGANEKASEAGIAIIGGHTVDDNEPKFGLAVTGKVHPEKIITNAASQPGDMLVLTKPIGSGILASARKQGLIEADAMEEVILSMSELNKQAAKIMEEVGAHACTDVTGFGLMGHLLGMMRASNTTAVINADKVPLFDKARDLASGGTIPGGTKDNDAFTAPNVIYDENISESLRVLLNDAQTSGGLLISLPASTADIFISRMKDAGKPAWLIGRVVDFKERFILVNESLS